MSAPRERPVFVVCEDGREYTDRFERTLGGTFAFVRAGCFEDARALLAARLCAGILLDLDFRRTPVGDLVDERGGRSPARSDEARHRLATVQGILVLQALRAAGVAAPALLFADLDDGEQVSFLETTLAPLTVVSSRRGLNEMAALMSRMAGGAGGPAAR